MDTDHCSLAICFTCSQPASLALRPHLACLCSGNTCSWLLLSVKRLEPLLEATKRTDSMPTESLPENDEFQICGFFLHFFGFLRIKIGKNKDCEQADTLKANAYL